MDTKTMFKPENIEWFLNRFSMVSLIIAGLIFIYQGLLYINMKKKNPDISDKIHIAAAFAILLGIAEIIFGIAHLWIG